MQFSATEWKDIYNKVHSLGKILRDSMPTYDEEGEYIAPKKELRKDAQDELQSQIKSLIGLSNRYLDHCGMKPRKPLWHYDRKNPETQVSSPEFKYGHLMSL